MAIVSPRASKSKPDAVPIDWFDPDEHRRKLAESINRIDEQLRNEERLFHVSGGTAKDIQDAIDLAEQAGGGIVPISQDFTIDQTLVLPSKVHLVGTVMSAVTLTAAASLNAAVIQSKNFATLTGQNKWKVVDGVQYDIGILNLRIDGNKANNTSGRGVELYAKQLNVGWLYIRDCVDECWYSEAGDLGGQDDWTDTPEGRSGPIWVRGSDTHGMMIRGPHDAQWTQIQAIENAGWGVRIERSANVYAGGTAVIDTMHIYSNTLGGVYANDDFQCQHMITENNFGEGWRQEEWGALVGLLDAYRNCKTTGDFNVVLTTSAQQCMIGRATVRTLAELSKSGMLIEGSRNYVGFIDARGNGATSTGTGLKLAGSADRCVVNGGIIRLFGGTGGTGLDLNDGGATAVTIINGLHIENCATLWNNRAGSSFSNYNMTLDASSGQTVLSGAGPNASQHEDWQIVGTDGSGVRFMTRQSLVTAGNINLNLATVQSLSVTHNLLLTPSQEDVQVSMIHTGGNTTFRYSGPWITSITSTTITAAVAVTTVAGAAATAKLLFRIRI